jgi:hypothetical protein
MVIAAVMAMQACGGSSSSPSAPTPTPSPNPAPTAPANVAGTYTLVLEASMACPGGVNFPSRVRQRVYTATVTQSGAQLAVNLSRATCTGRECSIGSFLSNVSSGMVSATAASFVFAFTERLTDDLFANDTITVYGTTADVPIASLAGSWNGFITYIPTNTTCTAANHGFSFRR